MYGTAPLSTQRSPRPSGRVIEKHLEFVRPTLLSAISTSVRVLGMVRSSWFMLSNDRRLHLDTRDQPALRQPFQAEAKRDHACYLKGVLRKLGWVLG